jgi:GR25 family glycosyltransferase involved in LPS biosynthesis
MADIAYYCINLDTKVDRWKETLKEYQAQGIPIQRFSAVVGTEYVRHIPPGHAGCYASHVEICKLFLKTTKEYLYVSEDDVIVMSNFKQVVESVPLELNQIGRWGICFLGRTTSHHNNGGRPRPVIRKYSGRFITNSFPLGTFGCLVTREFAERIIESFEGVYDYYDVELGLICDRYHYPKLTLKEPVIYENIWRDDSSTETNSVIQIHERINMSLYRRDYELRNLVKQGATRSDKVHNMSKWPELPIPVKHMLVGRPPNDLPDEEIIARTIVYLYGGVWESPTYRITQDDGDLLQALFTTLPCTTFVTALMPDTNYEAIGLFLDSLRYNKLVLHVGQNDVSKLAEIPIYDNMEIKIWEQLPSREVLISQVQTERFAWVGLHKYPLFTRWTFRNLPSDRVTLSGHRVDDYPRKNYIITGGCNQVANTPHKFLNNISKPLKVAFTDFWPGFTPRQLEFLPECVFIDPRRQPDVLLCSVFGANAEQYSAKKKVLISGEVSRKIDTSKYDLVISTSLSSESNNVTWVPYLNWCGIDIETLEQTRQQNRKSKSRFCSFVAQNNEPGFRRKFVTELMKHTKVDCAGSVLNNTGFTIKGDHRSQELVDFYSQSKFVICCENRTVPGYVTEKIGLGFQAGSIPIYWGASEITTLFNPKTFINLHDYETIESAINYILSITNEQINAMLDEPLFPNGIPEVLTKTYIQNLIFESG